MRGAELGYAELKVGAQISEAEALALQRVAQVPASRPAAASFAHIRFNGTLTPSSACHVRCRQAIFHISLQLRDASVAIKATPTEKVCYFIFSPANELMQCPQGGADPADAAEVRGMVVHDDDAVIWGMAAHLGPLPPPPEEPGMRRPITVLHT